MSNLKEITLRTENIVSVRPTSYAIIIDTNINNKRWFCKILSNEEYQKLLNRISTDSMVTLQLKERDQL